MLANPLDVVCVPLSSVLILLSTKRLRFVGGLWSGPSMLGPKLSTSSAPVTLDSAVNESPPKIWSLSGDVVDERRRRRRELPVMGGWSSRVLCDESARLDGNTVARIEGVEVGKEWSVLRDGSGRWFGMAGWSEVNGAFVLGMFWFARSTERQRRMTWRD